MSAFSEHLENYMKEHGITTAELARELEMDRATVFRYVKGKREPRSREAVGRMADALHMTLSDRKLLWKNMTYWFWERR